MAFLPMMLYVPWTHTGAAPQPAALPVHAGVGGALPSATAVGGADGAHLASPRAPQRRTRRV